jgi:hypothetical protein
VASLISEYNWDQQNQDDFPARASGDLQKAGLAIPGTNMREEIEEVVSRL